MLYGSSQNRGIIFKTTNGGDTWRFQVPDTSIHIFQYTHIKFINKSNGWAYAVTSGVHTTAGGDTTYLPVKNIGLEVPAQFKLYQNFPNPFNPKTIISYELPVTSYIKLIIYDITGKEITSLVNQKQKAGTYQVDFSGNGYSSGVYFYSLIVDSKITDTKRMILIKWNVKSEK